MSRTLVTPSCTVAAGTFCSVGSALSAATVAGHSWEPGFQSQASRRCMASHNPCRTATVRRNRIRRTLCGFTPFAHRLRCTNLRLLHYTLIHLRARILESRARNSLLVKIQGTQCLFSRIPLFKQPRLCFKRFFGIERAVLLEAVAAVRVSNVCWRACSCFTEFGAWFTKGPLRLSFVLLVMALLRCQQATIFLSDFPEECFRYSAFLTFRARSF